MKELIIKIWESFSPSFKRNLFPLIVGIAIVGMAFTFFNYTEIKNEEIKNVLKIKTFQLIVLLVVIVLSIIYINRVFSSIKLKAFLKISFLVIIVLSEVFSFYYLYQRPKTLIKIHIYQLDTPNYNFDILKLCASELNDNYSSFHFIIHNQQDIFSTNNQNEISADTLLNFLRTNHQINSKNEIVIALTPKMLFTNTTINLFSVSTINCNMISTFDWNYKTFRPVSIYQYIINQTMQCVLVSATRTKKQRVGFHANDVTTGCIFDYNYEKTGIINTIIRPKICKDHKTLIENYFGEEFFVEFEGIVKMFWWNKIIDILKKYYNYQS